MAAWQETSTVMRQALAAHAAIGIAVIAASAGTLILAPSTPVLVAVLLLLLLAGGGLLRIVLARSAEIDARLHRLSTAGELLPDLLAPVRGQRGASAGWNRLVESVHVQRLLNRTDEIVMRTESVRSDLPDEILLNSLPDGVALTDGDGYRLFENAALRSLLGLDERLADSAEQPLFELFREFRQAAPESARLNDLTSTAPRTFEMVRGERTEDGVLRVFRQGLPVAPRRFLWTVRDVTQQKLAVESRDHFVSAATHELRTPLCNIRAYAETLIAGPDLDANEQKHFLNVINTEAGRLDRIIDDLLSISHMQAGGMTLDCHETQVDRLIREVEETIRPLFASGTVEFETVLPPRLPELNVDKGKLAAALVNLLGNAVKYTPQGGKVRLEAESTDAEIRFHVEDTGIGISEDELPRVFDRFFRSRDDRLADIPGSGLGLAFAQDVARLHGGRIEVTSELNKGSRFSLVLPASLAQLHVTQRSRPATAAAGDVRDGV